MEEREEGCTYTLGLDRLRTISLVGLAHRNVNTWGGGPGMALGRWRWDGGGMPGFHEDEDRRAAAAFEPVTSLSWLATCLRTTAPDCLGSLLDCWEKDTIMGYLTRLPRKRRGCKRRGCLRGVGSWELGELGCLGHHQLGGGRRLEPRVVWGTASGDDPGKTTWGISYGVGRRGKKGSRFEGGRKGIDSKTTIPGEVDKGLLRTENSHPGTDYPWHEPNQDLGLCRG